MGKLFKCDLCGEGLDSRRQAFKHFDKEHGGAGSAICLVEKDSLQSATSDCVSHQVLLESKSSHYEEVDGIKEEPPEPIYVNDEDEQAVEVETEDFIKAEDHEEEAKYDPLAEAEPERGEAEPENFGPIAKTPAHQCPQCHKRFLYWSSLLHHNCKTKKQLLPCKLCDYKASRAYSLKSHHIRIHLKLKVKCGTCGKEYKSKRSLTDHHRAAHLGEKYKCDKCDFTCQCRRNLLQHINRRHHQKGQGQSSEDQEKGEVGTGKGLHDCDLCGKRYVTSAKLQEHHKSVHLGLQYKCTVCGWTCRRQSSLSYHKSKWHKNAEADVKLTEVEVARADDPGSPTRSYKCPICNISFSNRDAFQVHHRTVHRDQRFKCDRCSNTFSERYTVKRHQKWCRGGKSSTGTWVVCDLCGKGFDQLDKLERHHESVHSGKQRFTCDVCEKKCKTENSLKRHKEALHLGIRYHCEAESCGTSFTCKVRLNRHKLVCKFLEGHDLAEKNETPSAMTSSTKASLARNQRRKTAQDKPYSPSPTSSSTPQTKTSGCACDLCQLGFNCATLLKQSKPVKLAEGDYPCDICGRQYSHEKDLRRHREQLHSNVSFCCEEGCGKSFHYRIKLKQHQKNCTIFKKAQIL